MKGGEGACLEWRLMAIFDLRFFSFFPSDIFWKFDCAEGVEIYVCDALSNTYNLKLISQF